ncbi:MAG: hypothetical protein L3J16_07780, partial [Anaerolineales bacterium]|nr:hypothetical protein [Anaerolineales bacterium]
TSTPILRVLTVIFEHTLPNFPSSGFWLDYLATDRTCAVDTLPRIFGLMPARFAYRLNYFSHQPWYKKLGGKFKKTHS